MFVRVCVPLLLLVTAVSGAAWADDLPDIIIPDVEPLGFVPRPPPTVAGNFVPEGVEFFDGFFYLGNIPTGEIFRIAPDGVADVITPAGSSPLQQSVFGVDLDRERGLLHVASAKFPTSLAAAVQSSYLAVRLSDGEIVRSVDLSNVAPDFGKPRRANDLCFLETGGNRVPIAKRSEKSRGRLNPGQGGSYDVFVTDSNGAQIWKIDEKDRVTTFVTDPRFNANPADPTNPLQIGLNGIVCHPDGFLLDTDDGWSTASVAASALVPMPAGPPPSPTANGDRAGCVRATTGVLAGNDFFVSCSFTSSINKVTFEHE